MINDPTGQPRNLLTVPVGGASSDVSAALDRDGAVIVEDFLSTETVERLLTDLAEDLNATDPGSRSGSTMWESFHGHNTKRFTGLAARSRTFVDEVLLHPTLLSAADHLLLPHAADYWLNTGQIMAIGPGEPAQVLHRDEGNWPEAVSDDRELTISSMIALSDFTVESGATVVIPGSHRPPVSGPSGGTGPAPSGGRQAKTQAVMRRGSALLYTGKVVHGGGANTTAETWRIGLHVSFVCGWLRPEEASPLMVDRTLAESLPERARSLLGWSSYHSRGGGRTWLVDFEDASSLFA